MTGYLRHALATSTRSSYSSAAHSFQNFCITYNCLHPDGTLLPESEHTLMLFASFLARSLKPQSIKVYLYGVCTFHLDWASQTPSRELPGSVFSSGASSGYTGADLTHASQSPHLFYEPSTPSSTYTTMITSLFGLPSWWPSLGSSGAKSC